MINPNRWEQRVIKISRVSKVVKGGKKISFRAIVIVGDNQKSVGVGIGKANGVSTAIKKAEFNGKKNLITIPLTKENTITHTTLGVTSGANVFIRPAVPGTGVIAGGSVRIVLELAGIKNVLSKQLGSDSVLNNARAAICALKSLKTIEDTMAKRQLSFEGVFGKSH
uniref:Small ribosomal subunit protein uS5c n=1 Tax=Phaeophyceae sp. TaxID=2249243 RepID=A0A8E5BG80_9PHAE|nr:ribosomal protein S5 [Phaeophyceae sp.]